MAARLMRDYEAYWILEGEAVRDRAECAAAGVAVRRTDAGELLGLGSPLLREQAWYAGTGTHAFLATLHGEAAGLCVYWHGERYRTRNFWPLRADEAKLVQIVVEPAWRGRGVATALIACSARELGAAGFVRFYARVWHSNAPSIAAFHRAGWRRIALVLTAVPLGMRRRVRAVIPWRDRTC